VCSPDENFIVREICGLVKLLPSLQGHLHLLSQVLFTSIAERARLRVEVVHLLGLVNALALLNLHSPLKLLSFTILVLSDLSIVAVLARITGALIDLNLP
jgi:hypothetical protein